MNLRPIQVCQGWTQQTSLNRKVRRCYSYVWDRTTYCRLRWLPLLCCSELVPACGRSARLVDLLFLGSQKLSGARDHDSTCRRGREDRKACEGIGARGLSYRHEHIEELVEYFRWHSLDVRARWLQGSRSPRAGSPHHAPRPEGTPAVKLLDADDRKLGFLDWRAGH